MQYCYNIVKNIGLELKMEELQKAYEARAKKINKVEELKALRTPKEAFEQLEYYAKNGYDSISQEDKDYFLKCFGIYDKSQSLRRTFKRKASQSFGAYCTRVRAGLH